MSLVTEPLGNRLIAALPAAERQHWEADLEWVDMPLGKVLYESGCTMDYVYFPVTAIVSLLYVTEGGSTSELAVVGNGVPGATEPKVQLSVVVISKIIVQQILHKKSRPPCWATEVAPVVQTGSRVC